MRQWTRLIVDVDYHPCDSGNSTWYCERTAFPKSDLCAGKVLSYEDPGGLFGGIRVDSVSEDGLVLSYGTKLYSISMEHPNLPLDKDGRDYTEFELNLFLESAIVVEDTPAFYRQFYTRDQVARLRGSDIRALEASDAPAARFALGRWHYLLMPEEDSCAQAEKLFREAAEAGVADSFSALSMMYVYGDTREDRLDLDEMVRWRDEALARGSELAAYRYARNRIGGDLLAPKEPDVVRDEVEKRLATETDVWPEWYAVLGDAYAALDKPEKAREVYLAGVEHGSLHCYPELAMMAREREEDKEYRSWMEKGMAAGCGWCFILDGDLDEERFQAGDSRFKNLVSRQFQERFEQGLRRGEGLCAYYLGFHSFTGTLGFTIDEEDAFRYLRKGVALGDCYSCSLLADILEERAETPAAKKEVARLRLKAVRYGKDDDREQLTQDYRDGLLDEYRDEIEEYWLPDDDDVDEDDGRWDAYA